MLWSTITSSYFQTQSCYDHTQSNKNSEHTKTFLEGNRHQKVQINFPDTAQSFNFDQTDYSLNVNAAQCESNFFSTTGNVEKRVCLYDGH